MNELCNVNRHFIGITVTVAALSTMYYFTAVCIHHDGQINEFIKVLPLFYLHSRVTANNLLSLIFTG